VLLVSRRKNVTPSREQEVCSQATGTEKREPAKGRRGDCNSLAAQERRGFLCAGGRKSRWWQDARTTSTNTLTKKKQGGEGEGILSNSTREAARSHKNGKKESENHAARRFCLPGHVAQHEPRCRSPKAGIGLVNEKTTEGRLVWKKKDLLSKKIKPIIKDPGPLLRSISSR